MKRRSAEAKGPDRQVLATIADLSNAHVVSDFVHPNNNLEARQWRALFSLAMASHSGGIGLRAIANAIDLLRGKGKPQIQKPMFLHCSTET